jgi:hypothetical protein
MNALACNVNNSNNGASGANIAHIDSNSSDNKQAKHFRQKLSGRQDNNSIDVVPACWCGDDDDVGVDVFVVHQHIVVSSIAVTRSLLVRIVAHIAQFTRHFLGNLLALEMQAAFSQQAKAMCDIVADTFIPDVGEATYTEPQFAERVRNYTERIVGNSKKVFLPEGSYRESSWWYSNPSRRCLEKCPPKQLQFAHRCAKRDTVCDIAIEAVASGGKISTEGAGQYKVSSDSKRETQKAAQQQRGGKQSSASDSFLLACCCVCVDADDGGARTSDHLSGLAVHIPNPERFCVLRDSAVNEHVVEYQSARDAATQHALAIVCGRLASSSEYVMIEKEPKN